MKILCLHGACGNASVSPQSAQPTRRLTKKQMLMRTLQQAFRIQLSRFVRAMETTDKAQSIEFLYSTGAYEAKPPAGFGHLFGAGPFRKFINADCICIQDKAEDLSEKIVLAPAVLDECMNNIFDIVDNDPEIEVRVSRRRKAILLWTDHSWVTGHPRLLGRRFCRCHFRYGRDATLEKRA